MLLGSARAMLFVLAMPPARKRPGARLRLVPQLFHLYSDTRVARGPDGERFASINSDGRLKLWELESGRLLDPQTLRLSSGAVLTIGDWEQLRVQRPDGLTARLIVVEHGARLGLVAIDTEGHFDANRVGRSTLWPGAGLPSTARSRSDETLDALHRPGLLLRTLTPAS